MGSLKMNINSDAGGLMGEYTRMIKEASAQKEAADLKSKFIEFRAREEALRDALELADATVRSMEAGGSVPLRKSDEIIKEVEDRASS